MITGNAENAFWNFDFEGQWVGREAEKGEKERGKEGGGEGEIERRSMTE